jgi:hypothetical protein
MALEISWLHGTDGRTVQKQFHQKPKVKRKKKGIID